MANKSYTVNVTLPDLCAAHAEQQAKVEASSWPMAVRLACEEISRRPHVKGKHIKSASIQFRAVEVKQDQGEKKEHESAGRAIYEEVLLFDL
jgi:hypothetical protein